MTVAELDRDLGQERISPQVMADERRVEANVICIAVKGSLLVAGLGDGSVVAADWAGNSMPEVVTTHHAAVTGIAVDEEGRTFSCGQDGRLLVNGTELFSSDTWLASLRYRDKQVALAQGRDVLLFDETGQTGCFADHPSSVTGLAFDPRGGRLVASHYDGLSLWSLSEPGKPERLYWKGSMTGVSWSPDGRYVTGSTQDRELHVWDLLSGRDFRLGGFRAKVNQVAWSADSDFMVSTGADVIAAWPMAGDPGAFPPKEIGYVSSALVTAIADGAPPERIAGGFSNGTILIGDGHTGNALIGRSGRGGATTSIITSAEENRFYFGTRDGAIGWMSVTD